MDEARQSGFTLVELLVTLSVLAILVALAAPAMGQYLERTRLRLATEQLSQELKRARNHALVFQQPVFFSVRSVTPHRWCTDWSTQTDCDCFSTATACDARQHQSRMTSTDFRHIALQVPGARHGLRFSPVRGTASATSILLDSENYQTRIIVSPLGRVRTCSPDLGGYRPC